MPGDGVTLELEGLAPLLRAFKGLPGKLDKQLKLDLKKIAGLVAADAKQIAASKGLDDSGELIRRIRPGFARSAALVRESATRDGFAYPRIYEYAHGGARAFLHPAAEANLARTEAMLAETLNELVQEFDRGGPHA